MICRSPSPPPHCTPAGPRALLAGRRDGDGSLRCWLPADHHQLSPMLTDWRFTWGLEEQTKAFLDGFNEVVLLKWLQYFNEKELEVSWCLCWNGGHEGSGASQLQAAWEWHIVMGSIHSLCHSALLMGEVVGSVGWLVGSVSKKTSHKRQGIPPDSSCPVLEPVLCEVWHWRSQCSEGWVQGPGSVPS